MKDVFKGFYTPKEEALESAWKDEKTIFVFDTNVFLNLYGYAEQTRDDFFDLIEALGDKVWIPYQVGLEYQRRRLEIIKDEKAIFKKITTNLDKIEKVFKGDFEELALKRRFPILHKNTDKLSKEIHKNIANYKKSVTYWDEKQPCVRTHDAIREKLNEFTHGKIGLKPDDQDWLEKLYSEGEERYKNKIPPGFKDDTKAKAPDRYFHYDGLKYDRQFGDLILWMQLLDKAKTEDVDNVIFITDDSKEDWWYILDSRGKKQIGPHANLQSEIYSKSEIDLFHMYNTSSFLENGKEILKIGVHDSSIDDASTTFQESLANASRNIALQIAKTHSERDSLKDMFITIDDLENKEVSWKKFNDSFESKILDLETDRNKYSTFLKLAKMNKYKRLNEDSDEDDD